MMDLMKKFSKKNYKKIHPAALKETSVFHNWFKFDKIFNLSFFVIIKA